MSTKVDTMKPSDPIPISTPNSKNQRPRSMSLSSTSSASPSSETELPTPSSSGPSPRITIPSPGSSPILSYFLAQSPTKSPNLSSFPFRKFASPVFEEDEGPEELPATYHARRASTAVAGRFQQPQIPPIPGSHSERGAGLLRRLSLSTSKPSFDVSRRSGSPPGVPPNSAVSPRGDHSFAEGKPRRSQTISVPQGSPRARRAPSPMGERILKGHFDGFN